jgi:hypothetical protein
MVQVVFNAAGSDEKERRVQTSIATLVKKQVTSKVKCNCSSCHVVVTIGGGWRTGDFEVKEMVGCCLESLAGASEALAKPAKKRFLPVIAKPVLGHTAFAAGIGSGSIVLR